LTEENLRAERVFRVEDKLMGKRKRQGGVKGGGS